MRQAGRRYRHSQMSEQNIQIIHFRASTGASDQRVRSTITGVSYPGAAPPLGAPIDSIRIWLGPVRLWRPGHHTRRHGRVVLADVIVVKTWFLVVPWLQGDQSLHLRRPVRGRIDTSCLGETRQTIHEMLGTLSNSLYTLYFIKN